MDIILNDHVSNGAKLKAILTEQLLCNAYEEFLKESFAWESFGFFCDVARFKLADEETQQKIAEDIYHSYLDEEAIFHIGNVSVQEVERINNTLENPTINMFDNLQMEAFIELANSTINEFVENQLFREFQIHFKEYGFSKALRRKHSKLLLSF